jgi:hypothetical protein
MWMVALTGGERIISDPSSDLEDPGQAERDRAELPRVFPASGLAPAGTLTCRNACRES